MDSQNKHTKEGCAKCSNCGRAGNRYSMVEVYTGRVQWICWDCYKHGMAEANSAEAKNAHKRKLEERRKHQ